MERREMLKGAGAIALAALSGAAAAADDAHHHHHDHGAGSRLQPLAASAGDCIATGEACLAHCLVLLGQGDTVMAACAQSVNELLAVCAALQKLALQNAKHAVSFARVAADVCADCEKECRKHEKKHAECKACADSCAACLKECRKLTA